MAPEQIRVWNQVKAIITRITQGPWSKDTQDRNRQVIESGFRRI